jgi:hypothetical protein
VSLETTRVAGGVLGWRRRGAGPLAATLTVQAIVAIAPSRTVDLGEERLRITVDLMSFQAIDGKIRTRDSITVPD